MPDDDFRDPSRPTARVSPCRVCSTFLIARSISRFVNVPENFESLTTRSSFVAIPYSISIFDACHLQFQSADALRSWNDGNLALPRHRSHDFRRLQAQRADAVEKVDHLFL